MSADNHFQNSLRRSTAIAVWSLLAILLTLVTPDGSAGAAVCVVVLVSTLSAFALWITSLDSADDKHFLSAVVAFGMSSGWALRLGTGKEPFTSVVLIAAGFIPVAIAFAAVNYRSRMKFPNFLHWTFRIEPDLSEPIFKKSDELHGHNSAIGLYEFESEQSDESSREWKSPESPDVTQWLTRSRTADGDVIEGGIRIEFLAGQRDATVHISFCPPFRSTPKMTSEDLDGAGVEIRVAATFPFGARLTVRRVDDPALNGNGFIAETFRIGFIAMAMTAQRAA